MQVLRDSAAIRGAVTAVPSIAHLIDDLAEYGLELSELVRVHVVEPGDVQASIDAALGFPLLGRAPDLAEAHPGWFELRYVLSDDGFGAVVYVPDRPGVDARLIEHCRGAMS